MISPIPVLTVTQLNRQVRSWLEHEMGTVQVEGEMSNLTKPSSGHFYFTLKDATAQLRCVFFRNRHNSDHISIKNGHQVLVSGTLSLYEARGDYQLIVEQLETAGQGDLHRQFELLKAKLLALGLFDKIHKKALPRFPNTIGIITSASGAALRDILITLERRFPLAQVLIYPSEVQGKQAPGQLINALEKAELEHRAEVLILARGGGSIEDLWAFNDEQLAYAIAKCSIPIVSGVGHETDITIADFVADIRAATPTAAAEAVTPNWRELLVLLKAQDARLCHLTRQLIIQQQTKLHHEIQKMASPKRLIRSHWQSLDYLYQQLLQCIKQTVMQKRHTIQITLSHLEAKHPAVLLNHAQNQVILMKEKLIEQTQRCLHQHKQQFAVQLATLNAVSPLATLERGYAITTCQQHVVTNSEQVALGDIISIRLAQGALVGQIIEKYHA